MAAWQPVLLILFAWIRAPAAVASGNFVGSQACARCHRRIFESYAKTGMALSTGPANAVLAQRFTAATFLQAKSGLRYSLFQEGDGYFFRFVRDFYPAISGQRRIEYYIGSGAVGRSFVFSVGGFLFQAPVSWYSQSHKWDLSPGFDSQSGLYLSRPITNECLNCHATVVRAIAGTQNRYGAPPFREGGIGCERCHGPGEQHVATLRAHDIVNPARLGPARRDSVCAQCHLAERTRVARRGRAIAGFLPGEAFSDYAASFISSPPQGDDLAMTSHFERLVESKCKKASGDRLWCGTCHDPHKPPEPARRQTYFREKCLTCHRTSDCAKAGPDCVSCHMPKRSMADVGHVVYTDHSIPGLANGRRAGKNQNHTLVPYWGGSADPRDLGLVYAKLASEEQNQTYFQRAFDLLKRAQAEESADAEVLVQLAYLYDRESEEDRAASLYEAALRADAAQITAAVNLGAILYKRGRIKEAIRLWDDALSRNPGLEAAGINVARAHIRTGDSVAAQQALLTVLEYNPDSAAARQLLSGLGK